MAWSPHRPRTARTLVAFALLALALSASTPARADEYDPKRAGHPVRMVAYLFHPLGVLLDYGLFRPAHWVVMHEPMKTIFGHTD